jgi:hypothetical protein
VSLLLPVERSQEIHKVVGMLLFLAENPLKEAARRRVGLADVRQGTPVVLVGGELEMLLQECLGGIS